tara:strand:- start:10525 stop:10677 length:153 start_codon:yes stop_codon:yes gene_type:complete
MRIPRIDHVVDQLEKNMIEQGLTSHNDCVDVLTRVSEMITDLQWKTYEEE